MEIEGGSDMRTDGGRGRADEDGGSLWGGDCIRCDWFVKGARGREQVVEQARAHREKMRRTEGMSDAHKVVVHDPDGDLDGLAIGLMTRPMFRELARYEGDCERNGCENGGAIRLTTPTGMEQTDLDQPSPSSTFSPDDINAVCEECAAEYDNNLLFDEGPTSVNGFLESEKEKPDDCEE